MQGGNIHLQSSLVAHVKTVELQLVTIDVGPVSLSLITHDGNLHYQRTKGWLQACQAHKAMSVEMPPCLQRQIAVCLQNCLA